MKNAHNFGCYLTIKIYCVFQQALLTIITIKKMKIVIKILYILFFGTLCGNSQSAIPSWEKYSAEEGSMTIAMEFPQTQKILSIVKNRNLSTVFRNYFSILDKSGNEISKKEFKHDTHDIVFLDIAWLDQINKFIVFGVATRKKPFEQYQYDEFVTLQVDDHLNFSEFNIKKIGTLYHYVSCKVYNNGKEFLIVLSNHWNGFLEEQFEVSFIKVSYTGEIIQSTFVRDEQGGCQSVVPSINNNGYFCPGLVGYYLDSNFIFTEYEGLKPDSPLNNLSKKYWKSANFLWGVTKTSFPWTDGNYLICNTLWGYQKDIPIRPGQTVLFLMSQKTLDTLKTVGFGNGNSAFAYHSMDMTKDSMIYSGNYSLYGNAITIAKFNKKLEKIWELTYSYKDYINYIVAGIRVTQDGGFIIYGNRLINKASEDYIPFITKFDKNGGIISSTSSMVDNIVIKVFPNPVSNFLQLELSGANKNTEIRLFDLNGRNVFVQHRLSDGLNTIDLSALANGVYLYKIFQKGREIANDKIIKISE